MNIQDIIAQMMGNLAGTAGSAATSGSAFVPEAGAGVIVANRVQWMHGDEVRIPANGAVEASRARFNAPFYGVKKVVEKVKKGKGVVDDERLEPDTQLGWANLFVDAATVAEAALEQNAHENDDVWIFCCTRGYDRRGVNVNYHVDDKLPLRIVFVPHRLTEAQKLALGIKDDEQKPFPRVLTPATPALTKKQKAEAFAALQALQGGGFIKR